MKINRDSLLIKLIFYNNIAIVVTAIAIAFITTFITFQDMESRLLTRAGEKISLLDKAKTNYLSTVKEDLYEALRKDLLDKSKITGKHDIDIQLLKSELLKKDFQTYYRVGLAVVDSSGKILGKAGEKDVLSSQEIFDYPEISRGIQEKNYLVHINGKIYSKVIIPYNVTDDKKVKEYLVAAVPLDLNFLQYMKNFIELRNEDKIFAVVKDKYVNGDFSDKDKENFVSPESFNALKKSKQKYFYKKSSIEDGAYYLAILSLKDYKDEYIGNFGVAVSREEVFRTKVIVGVFISIIVFMLVGICTTVFTKILRNLISPLRDITEAAERISMGDYETPIKLEGSGEIKTLAISIKKMLGKLEENQKKLKSQNKKLKENLNKITTIEQLLLGIQIEDDVTVTVRKIMSAFTSEMGLGFSRCMFFRYSRERDVMMGECTRINSHIAEIKNDILKERKSGFDFQINELKDIVPLIKIPFSEDNISSRALKTKDIIYYNDKGYKYDLGNDLFKSLGLKNFLIFPIYNVDYYSGVIVCDYFTKDKDITEEDIELLRLLLMNISVKLKNKTNEEDRIEIERNTTISKISERFINTRQSALNKLLDILEKTKNQDNENISDRIQELEEQIRKIKKSNKTLMEYSTQSKNKLERVNIEHLMAEVIEEFKRTLALEGKEKDIIISSFISYTGDVFGDNNRLKKAFIELLKNAYDATMLSKNLPRKINVIVIRDKHANKIKIDIKDNGIGMSEERIKTIQEPFVTYKDEAPGLGIPLVMRVIKDCRGVIKFNSVENEGTTIKITLNLFREDIKS
ncbi:ATP-binding protein [Fusobacterium sp.]|uniref:ATP-binding protein n=1 Tax=Fusobacterium sp. TaxID=68766 RepID=UPI002607AF9A|nr:ATP-binding protein [Fusobacterium sp.]